MCHMRFMTVVLQYHTGAKIFDTHQGLETTKGITALAHKFNISYASETAPQDYFLSRCV